MFYEETIFVYRTPFCFLRIILMMINDIVDSFTKWYTVRDPVSEKQVEKLEVM